MTDQQDRFQMDVEVVSRALRQRSGHEDAGREARKLYQKFTGSRQEPIRLAVALRGFFLEEGVTAEERDAYGVYLKGRIRPAVCQLIEEEAVEKLDRLRQLGWLDGLQMDSLLKTAREKGKIASQVWLLRMKEETCGYRDRDFSL